MVIEIFGLTFKPEISISDIAAIGALIASPLIFYFGYSQTRKSEQIRIARELADRIDAKIQKLKGIRLDEARTQNGVKIDKRVSEQKAAEVLDAIHDLLPEIEYFFYLLDIHEIRDRNLITYYFSAPLEGVRVATTYLDDLKKRGIDMATPPDLESVANRLDSVFAWAKRYQKYYVHKARSHRGSYDFL